VSNLFDLVGRLGVERRHAPRIRFPDYECHIHPIIEAGGTKLRIHDISVGGCCLIDPHEILGLEIGNEINLTLHWHDGSETIRARIVARVDDKRHIQFLNLRQERVELLKFLIEPATRGALVHRHAALKSGPALQAREIWSSFQGDSVTVEDHVHRLAQICLFGVEYTLFKSAWPVKEDRIPLTRQEVVSLILFLANVNHPSPLLNELSAHLQNLSLKGAK
jgi:hypothetical protein